MIRRTGCCSETLHLLDHERYKGSRIQDSLCLLIKISLIGRTTTFGHTKETVFHSFCSLDVYLGRQITFGIDFFIHAQRSILAVTEVFFRISLIYTFGQCFFITIAGPYLLSFFTMDDSGTGILTQRKLTFNGNLGIAEESQSHILVIVACFGILQDLCHLLVM